MNIPEKLKQGDEIRVIASSRSLKILSDEGIQLAKSRLEDLGFKVTFGKYVRVCDLQDSSSIEQRVEDLHEAFADKNVKGILTVIGGFNSNELLPYIDFGHTQPISTLPIGGTVRIDSNGMKFELIDF